MGNLKDDGKKMDPLFPRLHITDADKGGGPRTPPRNKMAISQQRSVSGSHSTTNASLLVPASPSSCHDASYKRSMFSTYGRSCGSTRLATRLDSYHSSGINLNISLTTVKQTIETTNCQTLCNTGHPKPQDFRTTRNNTIVKKLEFEDDNYMIPSFTFGNGQQNTKKGTFPTLSTNVYQKQLKLTDKEITHENNPDTMMTNYDVAREPVASYNSDRGRFSELLNEDVSPSIKRTMLIDEHQMIHDPNIGLPLKRKCFQENMTYKDGTKKTWTLLGDNKKIDRGTHAHAHVHKSEDHGYLHLGNAGKISEKSEADFLSGFDINPGEVSQLIGPEQYCIARITIIQQQRIFKSQLFELHRLIKVQKILAESPDLLIEEDEIIYKLNKAPSEDMFPHLEPQKENHEPKRIYNPNLADLPPPPTSNGGKQPPWCFLPPPPPGNQWLVPVRSPSEGLVYKPLTGPSPPPVGLMPPVYGMSLLTPSNPDFHTSSYNIPTSYPPGVGVYPSTSLLTSYGFPTITKHICSSGIDESVNYNKNVKIAGNIESDLQGRSGSSSNDRKKGDELPLFPTTPTVQDSDQCTEEKRSDERAKVIKVVPRNPKWASESATRIFQFIQEERKHNTNI
ncbi:hypothetical protein R6Q57_020740 [Mikania cordata]